MPAYVILPDHLHCIWQLPMGDDDFSLRWRLIKHFVSRGWNRVSPVWQKRYWEHCIRNEKDFKGNKSFIVGSASLEPTYIDNTIDIVDIIDCDLVICRSAQAKRSRQNPRII